MRNRLAWLLAMLTALLGAAAMAAPAAATGADHHPKVTLTGEAACSDTGWRASFVLRNNSDRTIVIRKVTTDPDVGLDTIGGGDTLGARSAVTIEVDADRSVKLLALTVWYTSGAVNVEAIVVQGGDGHPKPRPKPWSKVTDVVHQCRCAPPTTVPPTTTPPTTVPTTPPTHPTTIPATTPPTTAPPTTPGPTVPPTTTAPPEATAVPDQPGSGGGGPQLPVTGPAGPLLAGGALVLIGAGVLVLMVARRRRARFIA